MSLTGKCRYPMIDPVGTGANIKRLREMADMSIKDFAKIFGVTPTAVYKWQLGVSIPNIDNMVLIAHIFDISLDELIVRK